MTEAIIQTLRKQVKTLQQEVKRLRADARELQIQKKRANRVEAELAALRTEVENTIKRLN